MNPSSLKFRRTGKITLLITILCVSALNGILHGMEKEATYESLPAELKQQIINTALSKSNDLLDAIKTIKAFSALHGINYNLLIQGDALVKALMKKFPAIAKDLIVFASEQPELYQKIDTYNVPDDAINALITASKTDQILDKIINEKYGTLVRFIADKFKITTRIIVDNFKMQGSKKYLNLIEELHTAITNNNITQAKAAINQGADVNYSWIDRQTWHKKSLLSEATKTNNLKMVKLLLDAGANPNLKHNFEKEEKHQLIKIIDESNPFPFGTYEHYTYWKATQKIKTLIQQAMQNYPQ